MAVSVLNRYLLAVFMVAWLPQMTLAQSLYELSQGVITRWASPENPTGEKGRAATAAGGRKGSPTIPIKAGESVVLAEANGLPALASVRKRVAGL